MQFNNLPPEIYSEITNYFTDAKQLQNLLLASRSCWEYFQSDDFINHSLYVRITEKSVKHVAKFSKIILSGKLLGELVTEYSKSLYRIKSLAITGIEITDYQILDNIMPNLKALSLNGCNMSKVSLNKEFRLSIGKNISTFQIFMMPVEKLGVKIKAVINQDMEYVMAPQGLLIFENQPTIRFLKVILHRDTGYLVPYDINVTTLIVSKPLYFDYQILCLGDNIKTMIIGDKLRVSDPVDMSTTLYATTDPQVFLSSTSLTCVVYPHGPMAKTVVVKSLSCM